MRVLAHATGPVALKSAPRPPPGKVASQNNNLAKVEEEDDPFFFGEFLNFCSNKFCLVDSEGARQIEAGEVDDRNSLTQRLDELESNTRNKNDDWSCDSTLNSSGIFSTVSSKQEKIRFVIDPRLTSLDDASVATLASVDERKSERSLTLKERWDAIYAPTPPGSHIKEHHLLSNKNQRHQHRRIPSSENRSYKSEPAKATNRWTLNLLENHQKGLSFDSRVLGTSSNDQATQPIVFTSSLMDAIQNHLPYSKRGQSFWLKYSMVRDGANLRTVLEKTKRSAYTILAVETLDGEVFGAFTAKPWHITWKYYGTPESFLWRLRKRRKSHSRDKPINEGDFEVFCFAGNNKNIQLCNIDRIALGGGTPDDETMVSDDLSHVKLTEWGFGLAFGKDLQQGTSSPCMTFNSPSLSRYHADGSRFEVANMEFWTLTPCISLDEAKSLEKSMHMIDSCSRSVL